MDSITFFSPYLYNSVNIYIIFALCVYAYLNYSNMHNEALLYSNSRSISIIHFYILIFIIVVGLRPVKGCFADMRAYTWSFESVIQCGGVDYAMSLSKEWIWATYVYILGNLGGIHLIFFATTLCYVLFNYLAIYRLFKYRRDVALLFLFGFFSFFAYATNTIRAGLAMSLVLLALTFLINFNKNNIKSIVPGIVLCMIAFGIHRSSLLPIASFVLVFTCLRNTKLNIKLWIICVFVSLVIGAGLQETVMNMVMSSDFQDQRIVDYMGRQADDTFLRTGFRWDFILFSSLPILVGIYVVFIKKVQDETYSLLLNTYIIANAFWVLINRAAFSDRFAYLSWFMFPIVIAYPFLKINIEQNQASLMCKLLLAVSGFTLFMNVAYYD